MASTWVVYQIIAPDGSLGPRAVCSQTEWLRIESGASGTVSLIRSEIASEADAERLARGTSGDPKPSRVGGQGPPHVHAPWTAEMDARLSTGDDEALARELGKSVEAIRDRRRRLGL